MLMLVLAGALAGAEGTLLCFSMDGHVAIEFVDACKGSWPGSQIDTVDTDACGPCHDLQLPGDPACRANASQGTPAPVLISSSAAAASLTVKEQPRHQSDLPDHTHHKTLASLHSVVLLI